MSCQAVHFTTTLTNGQRKCDKVQSEWTQHCIEKCGLEMCNDFVLEIKYKVMFGYFDPVQDIFNNKIPFLG